MDEDKASRFISSLVKSIQALCNGFVDFSTSIEVVGHIHLNIDRNVKLDYVLTEEVSKSVSEGSTVFSSHSYHSQAPPSVAPKGASDSSNSSHKTRKDNDPLGLSALAREVPNSSKSDSHSHSLNRVSESSNSSHSGNVGFSRTSDIDTLKQENNRTSCQLDDSANRRRKMGQLSQTTPSPAAKRVRTNDYSLGSKTVIKEQGFEVIEIKEEPDDEPTVFFGSSGPGQDIQTPDFTNVVMESLDRVNQLEGSELGDGGGGDAMGGPQQPVFPVMFHQSDGMSSSGGPVPGPSSDPQSVASTSGEQRLPGAAAGAWKEESSPGSEDCEGRKDRKPTTSPVTASVHVLERGEGRNHHCAVCQRNYCHFRNKHPGKSDSDNPFKRSKTPFRCRICMEVDVVYSENEKISVQLASKEEEDSSSSPPLPPLPHPGSPPTVGRTIHTMVATIPCATWNRRGRYKNYSESDVMHGLQMMVSGQSVKKASDASGVPQSTLTDRMNRLNLRKKSDVDLQLLKKLQSSQQPEEGVD